MIEEAYVSFETAKLLKEKGFDEPCRAQYRGIEKISYSEMPNTFNKTKYWYSCPTQQMVIRWLREEYNIFIEISVSIDLNGNYHYSYSVLDEECQYHRKGYTDFDWTYEEAVEAACIYVLENLIEEEEK